LEEEKIKSKEALKKAMEVDILSSWKSDCIDYIKNNQGCCEGKEEWVVTVVFAGHDENAFKR